MKKKILVVVALVIVMLCGLVGCGDNEESGYTVAISSMTNGSVVASKTKAEEGETVTLTVTPGIGYVLKEDSLKYDSTAITGNSFVMPSGDVVIHAQFKLSSDALNGKQFQFRNIVVSYSATATEKDKQDDKELAIETPEYGITEDSTIEEVIELMTSVSQKNILAEEEKIGSKFKFSFSDSSVESTIPIGVYNSKYSIDENNIMSLPGFGGTGSLTGEEFTLVRVQEKYTYTYYFELCN